VCGGASDHETLQIEPTVMTDITWDDAVMQEEIFGPVLPIMTYETVDEAVMSINAHANPLALYVFTGKKSIAKRFLTECLFGGGCVNDTIIHIASNKLGFGGVGESGMGIYHGKWGFDTFSHNKAIVDKKTWIDLPMRYQPYKSIYGKLLRIFLR